VGVIAEDVAVALLILKGDGNLGAAIEVVRDLQDVSVAICVGCDAASVERYLGQERFLAASGQRQGEANNQCQ
jgi:hypothetical protein